MLLGAPLDEFDELGQKVWQYLNIHSFTACEARNFEIDLKLVVEVRYCFR